MSAAANKHSTIRLTHRLSSPNAHRVPSRWRDYEPARRHAGSEERVHLLLAGLLALTAPTSYGVHVTSLCGTEVDQSYRLESGGKDGFTQSKWFGTIMDRVTGPPITRYAYSSHLSLVQSGARIKFYVVCNNANGVVRLDGYAAPGQRLVAPAMIAASVDDGAAPQSLVASFASHPTDDRWCATPGKRRRRQRRREA